VSSFNLLNGGVTFLLGQKRELAQSDAIRLGVAAALIPGFFGLVVGIALVQSQTPPPKFQTGTLALTAAPVVRSS
jgi:hypothetical protein